jgi:hypothetical protein
MPCLSLPLCPSLSLTLFLTLLVKDSGLYLSHFVVFYLSPSV